METRPRKIGNRLCRVIERIVERVIPNRWRDEMGANLYISSLFMSPGRYLLRAADLLSFAIISEMRRALRTSPMFDPNKMGLVIALLGYLASLYEAAPGGPVNDLDFTFGLISGLAMSYWLAFAAGRSMWIVWLFILLLTSQVSLVLLNVFVGHLSALNFGGWGILVTLLSVSADALQRWLSPAEKQQ